MLMEVMGLHLPGGAFVPPNTPLRDALTAAATKRAARITALGNEYLPLSQVVDERCLVNAIGGLHATGGSTNHTLHIVAIAQAAGLIVNWDDFSDLSDVVPLLARIYPNGGADVNHFHAASGMGFLIRELLGAGLLHEDVLTVSGKGLAAYAQEPFFSPLPTGSHGVMRRPSAARASGGRRRARPAHLAAKDPGPATGDPRGPGESRRDRRLMSGGLMSRAAAGSATMRARQGTACLKSGGAVWSGFRR
jgi:dihydroxyacid dehydratase/phosphogluconate dehydratase